jgi:hypothetical protein
VCLNVASPEDDALRSSNHAEVCIKVSEYWILSLVNELVTIVHKHAHGMDSVNPLKTKRICFI